MQTQQTPQVLQQPFAAQGDKNTIPNAATGTNKASLQEGFPPITGQPINQGGIPPERQDFNGAMNLNSQFYFAFQNGWWPTFTQEVSDAIGGYPQGAVLWLFDTENNVYTPLLSLVGNNTYNFNTNKDYIGQYWAKILPDSGRGLPLGAIYFSSSSNADDNPGALPLWSGAYYTNASTLYPAFYAWVKSHTELCKTKTEYDAAVSTYGECPYYVVDEVAGSLRLPKLVNYLKMANSTDGITQAQAGLPNITGSISFAVWSNASSGCFYDNGGDKRGGTGNDGGSKGSNKTFDASRSSSVYGKSSTVTPAHTTVFPWVVSTASDAESSAAAAAQSADAAATSAAQAAGSASAAAQSAQEAASSANLADIQNKITNCITKIPQDIKLTLVDGVLTLKAGSKIYFPDGSAQTVTSDTTISNLGIANEKKFVFIDTAHTIHFTANCYSGSSQPSGGTYYKGDMWFDTGNQAIKRYDGSNWTGSFSFPLCTCKITDGGVISAINQVFNGFGYIGQTLFALPGVEGLSPGGRNTDGSLYNYTMTVSNVLTRAFTWSCDDGQYLFVGQYNTATATEATEIISSGELYNYFQQSEPPSFYSNSIWHRLDENKVYKTDNDPTWNPISLFAVGRVFNTGAGTNVSSLTIGNPVAAVDMSNTSYMSKMGMPSGKKISISWGATNTEYTAPANGFFYIQGQGNTAGNVYIEADVYQTSENILYREGRCAATTNILRMTVPVQAGYKLKLRYDNKITNSTQIAFVFAEGEK